MTDSKPSSSKFALVALVLLFFGPMALAYFYVNFGQSYVTSAGEAANGQLVTPLVVLQEFNLDGLAGTKISRESIAGKWTYVTFAPSSCGKECIDNLYKVRQVRLTQPDDLERIQRLLVLTDSDSLLAPAILKDHPGLLVGTGTSEEVAKFRGQFGETSAPPAGAYGIYLVDPLGNFFMKYEGTANPSDMKKDIHRLMKYSKIG